MTEAKLEELNSLYLKIKSLRSNYDTVQMFNESMKNKNIDEIKCVFSYRSKGSTYTHEIIGKDATDLFSLYNEKLRNELERVSLIFKEK